MHDVGNFGSFVGGVARTVLPARAAKHLIGYGNYIAGEPELRLVSSFCELSKSAVDVGANFGAYTYWLAKGARTVAIEPLPKCATFLRSAFPEVEVVEVALSDRNGQGHMEVESRVGREVHTEAKLRMGGVIPETRAVLVRRLDDLGIERIGFVKIDTEGHELAVLHGASRTLDIDRPVLLIECEERHRPGALQSVLNFLRPIGYEAGCLTSLGLRRIQDADSGYAVSRTSNFFFVHSSNLRDLDRFGGYVN